MNKLFSFSTQKCIEKLHIISTRVNKNTESFLVACVKKSNEVKIKQNLIYIVYIN